MAYQHRYLDGNPLALPAGKIAVSYTHLDVYKRQPLFVFYKTMKNNVFNQGNNVKFIISYFASFPASFYHQVRNSLNRKE